MKAIFVYPDIIVSSDPNWNGYFYEGLASLSAVLKRAGHETALVHVPRAIETAEVVRRVGEQIQDPASTFIAFSSTTNQFPYVRSWAPALKEAFGLFQITGGIHPTLSPEDAIAAPGLDAICRSDGEAALVTLANRLADGQPIGDIPNLWVRGPDGEIQRNAMGSLPDLAELPFPDWDLYTNIRELILVKDNVGVMMGSRGCPYDCSYCCNRALLAMSKGRGKYMRFKPVETFLREIEAYLEFLPNTWGFFFEDDIFGVKKTWLREFADKYPARIGKPFGCNMRPNMVKQQLVDDLARAGCIRVQMAIESGNEEVRNEILNRSLSNEQLLSSFEMFKQRGIQVVSYNMVGSPHESPRAVLDTIKINARIAPELIQHSITFPYAGTKLYELCEEEGLIEDREVTDYFEDSALKLTRQTRAQTLFFHHNFKTFVKLYQRLWKLPWLLRAPLEKTFDFAVTRRSAPRLIPPLMRLCGKLKRRSRAALM